MKTLLFLLMILLNLTAGVVDKNRIDELISKGEFVQVIKLLEGNLEDVPENYSLWISLGKAYQGLMNYNKANEALYVAYNYNKSDLLLIMAIGRNYVQMGASQYSLLFFEQAYDMEPDNFNIMIELGQSYYDVRRFEDAKSIYENLVAKDSTNSFYSKQLGMCYYKMNKTDEALHWLEKSFLQNERDGSVALILAGILVNNKKYSEALRILSKSQQHNPSGLQTNKLAAETLFKMQRYDDAAMGYKLVIQQGDSTAGSFQKLGFCFYFAESGKRQDDSLKYKLAIESFAKAVEKDSADALSYIYLGICYKERKEFKKSIEYIERGIKKSFPSYLSDAYAQLGSSYYMDEQFPLAIRTYQEALKLDPAKTTILFHLAAVYDRYYADKQIAMGYYQKFLTEQMNADLVLKNYAEERCNKLREVIHFRNGRLKR